MGRVISLINVTPDGFCDHTAVVADNELHQYCNSLLAESDAALFGSTTYQLFENYWPTAADNFTASPAEKEFSKRITRIPKVVLSNSLKNFHWENTSIVPGEATTALINLRERYERDIVIFGSPGLMSSLTALHLIDEYQFCVQPIVAGNGKRLFDNNTLTEMRHVKLSKAKTLASGVVILTYTKSK